jgi:hypothetical protein
VRAPQGLGYDFESTDRYGAAETPLYRAEVICLQVGAQVVGSGCKRSLPYLFKTGAGGTSATYSNSELDP